MHMVDMKPSYINSQSITRIKKNIKYHVACKANGDGCMDENKFEGVTKINNHEFELHNARCFKIDVPQIGPAQAIYYDVVALKTCCEYIKKNHIPHPIVYIMACRIGPFAGHFYKEIFQYLRIGADHRALIHSCPSGFRYTVPPNLCISL